MATSSFDQEFVLTDPVAIEKLFKHMETAQPIKFTPRDLEADRIKGLALLAKAFGIPKETV